jgi:Holliday junction resolvase-like predicted endonuclease
MKIKKAKTKSSEIANFLHESGFILEMEASEFLEKNGYDVQSSQYFFDAEELKNREIDLIATKIVNDIAICLIIECKQNLGDDWVFISTQKNPKRYYNELKHSPRIPAESLKQKQYDDLHVYNFRFALAQNYLVYRSEKGKRSKIEPLQIRESTLKLPKVVVWTARDNTKFRTIYLPVILFSGRLFLANYQKRLIVKEKMLVQFQTTLESLPYYEKPDMSYSFLSEPRNQNEKVDPDVSKAKTSSKKLGKFFVIDIISRKGLKRFLTLLEKEVSQLDLNLWPISEGPKSVGTVT